MQSAPKHNCSQPKDAEKGFSLIELSLVLVVVGLLLSVGISSMRTYQTMARLKVTRQRQTMILNALKSHLILTGALPCPSPASHSGKASLKCPDAASFVGFVPFLTLGLSGSCAKDGHGKSITYAVDPSLTYACRSRYRMCFSFYARASKIDVSTITQSSVNQNMTRNEGVAFVLVAHGPGRDRQKGPIFYEIGSQKEGIISDCLLWRTKGVLLQEAGLSCADHLMPAETPFYFK